MFFVFLLVFATALPLLASDKTSEGLELLKQVREKSDIYETPTFEMKAKLTIVNPGKKPLEGTYSLLWNGPDQWRDEMSFPGFQEIRVGTKGSVATKRNLDFLPLRVHQVKLLLSYGRAGLTVRQDEAVKGIHKHKVNGVETQCVEVTRKGIGRGVCIDTSNGTLVRDRPFVDKDLTPFGSKLYPRVMSYIEEGNTVAEVEISELRTTETFTPADFQAPAGAISKPGCEDPTVGKLVDRLNPQYPETERRTRTQGTVALYAEIGTDGAVHNLRVISGVSRGLDASALEAVRQWRYEPYLCGNTPIEVESVIQVNYSLTQ